MSKLNVTIIDVGWGDSIFLESTDGNGDPIYALVDSNDEVIESDETNNAIGVTHTPPPTCTLTPTPIATMTATPIP